MQLLCKYLLFTFHISSDISVYLIIFFPTHCMHQMRAPLERINVNGYKEIYSFRTHPTHMHGARSFFVSLKNCAIVDCSSNSTSHSLLSSGCRTRVAFSFLTKMLCGICRRQFCGVHKSHDPFWHCCGILLVVKCFKATHSSWQTMAHTIHSVGMQHYP